MEKSAFEALILQLKAGNNRCLKFIFEEHSDFCISNLKRSGASEDSANDIFVDAVLNFRQKMLEGKISYLTNIRNYVYGTCKYMFMEQLRAEQKALDHQEEVVMFFQPHSAEPDFETNETREYEDKLMGISLEAYNQLGSKCRQMLDFFYIDKKNMAEIAEIMGLASANVAKATKSRCFKKWGDIVGQIKLKMEKEEKL